MFLDKLHDEYQRKEVGIVGMSSGGFGGSRMATDLRRVLHAIGFHPLKNSVYISYVENVFHEKDDTNDINVIKQIENFIKDLKA